MWGPTTKIGWGSKKRSGHHNRRGLHSCKKDLSWDRVWFRNLETSHRTRFVASIPGAPHMAPLQRLGRHLKRVLVAAGLWSGHTRWIAFMQEGQNEFRKSRNLSELWRSPKMFWSLQQAYRRITLCRKGRMSSGNLATSHKINYFSSSGNLTPCCSNKFDCSPKCIAQISAITQQDENQGTINNQTKIGRSRANFER